MMILTEWSPGMEVLTEQTDSGKVLYLEGIMIMTEQVNRNGRVYPKGLMEQSVEKYNNEYIKERRSIGELNHPSRPFADPASAALMIESLNWHGDNVVGKARVLNNPFGQQIKSLVEANFKMGVSTRGLGDVKNRSGRNMVEKYMLNAIDAVDMPSGQNCYVNALHESTEWVQESGVWIEKQNEEKALQIFLEKFAIVIENIKKGNK